MPITYQLDTHHGMLYVTAEGAPSGQEIMTAMQKWWSDPDFRPGLLTLVDGSSVTALPTLSQLEDIVGFMRRHATEIGRKKMAIVTARPVAYGVARQFCALAPNGLLTVQVFKDRDAALAWLGEGRA